MLIIILLLLLIDMWYVREKRSVGQNRNFVASWVTPFNCNGEEKKVRELPLDKCKEMPLVFC